jgi:tetratricopeptide (TPR) repeat protein
MGGRVAGLLAVLWATSAFAGDAQEERARAVYRTGQEAFAAEHYQEAYDAFKRAYLLWPQPALLYNMASALQGLGKPHLAAEELRAYLRTNPETPERRPIEERIRALEEAQRLLDSEEPRPTPAPAQHSAPPVAAPVHEAARPTAPPPQPLVPLVESAPPPRRPSRVLTIAIPVAAVAVLAVGLGLGLGLGLHDWHTASTLGDKQATP